MRWLIIISALVVFASSAAPAQDVIFIPGAEIDGIFIESFYLSSAEITNQDYFIFIQRDGYRKKFLWDNEVLQDFDKFKNSEGAFAPRSWKANSPPMGQEFHPVLSISVWEARAYAKNLGWTIPNKMMWKLAQQSRPEIGPYPWEGSNDNLSAIRMTRYHAPAKNWEERLAKVNDELDRLKKSSTAISGINRNTARIHQVQNSQDDLIKKLESLQRQVQTINNKLSTEKLQQLENSLVRLDNVEAQLNKMNTLQGTFFTNKLPNLESRLKSLENLEDKLKNYDKIVNDQKKLKDLCIKLELKVGGMVNNLTTNGTKLIKIEQKLKTWESKIEYIDVLTKSVTGLSAQGNTLDGKIRDIQKQNENFTRETTSLRTTLSGLGSRMDAQDKNLEEIFKQLVQVKSLAGNLDNKLQRSSEKATVRSQKLEKLEKSVEETSKKTLELESKNQGWNKQLQVLQKIDGQHQQQIFGLNTEIKKQATFVAKDTKVLKETVEKLSSRLDRQAKSQGELYSQSAQIKAITDDLNSKIERSNKIDIGQTQKTEKLEQNLEKLNKREQELHAKNLEWQKLFDSLQETDVLHRRKFFEMKQDISNSVAKLEKKHRELSGNFEQLGNGLDIKMKTYKTESYNILQSELSKISTKVTSNYGGMAALQQKVKNMDKNYRDDLNGLRNKLETLTGRTDELQTELREGSRKLRSSMLKIGKDIHQMFKPENMGTLSEKEQNIEVSPDKNNNNNPVPVKISAKDIEGLVSKVAAKEVAKMVTKEISRITKEIQTIAAREATKEVERIAPRQVTREVERVTAKEVSREVERVVAKEVSREVERVVAKEVSREVERKAVKEIERIASQEITKIVAKMADKGVTKVVQGNATVDTSAIADLCHKLGDAYYRQGQSNLATACLDIGLKFQSDNKNINDFYHRYWSKINCPEDMAYVKGTDQSEDDTVKKQGAFLGSPFDPEFPETRKTFVGFYMDKYEVTRGQFDKFVKSGAYSDKQNWSEAGVKYLKSTPGYQTAPIGWQTPQPWEAELPVVNINYYEAEAYAKWQGKRLPTADEWEYAARGEDKRRFPWGNERLKTKRIKRLLPVQSLRKDKSPHGIFGMAGNVAEWCTGPYYYKRQTKRAKYCPVKGGSYKSYWFRMLTFSQIPYQATDSLEDVGFRCVKSVPPRK